MQPRRDHEIETLEVEIKHMMLPVDGGCAVKGDELDSFIRSLSLLTTHLGSPKAWYTCDSWNGWV